MVIIQFGQIIKFKIIYNNIPHTPSNVGVVARKTFSFTPDEAMSVGLAKACVRRIKSILFIEKSNALKDYTEFNKFQKYRQAKQNQKVA